MKINLITDSQSIVAAKSRFGQPIPIYDDGFGLLFIHRDSMGISGIVRAQTWEDAYSICEDEFFTPGDDGEEKNHAQNCWEESYGYRGNGRKMDDGSVSYIYAKDLNGDSLEKLTSELLALLEITLEIVENK